LSMYLIKKRNQHRAVPDNDYAQIKGRHPDLANPPVYPVVLAAWIKTYPAVIKAGNAVRSVMPGFIKARLPDLTPTLENRLWQSGGKFSWAPHDFFIAVFNEAIFFAVIVLTFLLARRLFDEGVAWVSGLLLLTSDLLWRFSVSGLSTMLLLLIFTGLVWCLVYVEREAREPKFGSKGVFLFAAGAGVLIGLGALTRYSFGWLVVPVAVFFILFGGPRKAALCLLAVGLFACLMSPWVYRNMKVSGLPFGTATFAVMEGTSMFPEHRLERSLNPDFNRLHFTPFTSKLLANSRVIVQNDLPKLGGSWLTPLFLAGLLLGFRNPAIRRLRYFLIASLVMLIIVQAMGRTQLAEESPEINSENLLVLLLPLVFVYGVSLFFQMLDQMNLLFKGARFIVIGAFMLAMSLPMIFTFLPPKPSPVAYPPYYPPVIQQVSGWMKENELMMSDMPWAVAWYGHRQCVWLTLKATTTREDPDTADTFFEINDYQKPIRALYLTPQTMDARFLSQWILAGEHSWGSFILESLVLRDIPPNFPLRKAPRGFMPHQLFLSDWERWKTEPVSPTPPGTEQPGKPSKPSK